MLESGGGVLELPISSLSMNPLAFLSYDENCAVTFALTDASVLEMRPSLSLSSDSKVAPCDSCAG